MRSLASTEDWAALLEVYQKDKSKMWICKRCRTIVGKSGPRPEDAKCIDVCVRHVMEK